MRSSKYLFIFCALLLLVSSVQVVSAEGYEYIGQWGSSGSGDGQFYYPFVIAVDSAGDVYVTDYNNRVQKFNSTGGFITQWGSSGSGDGKFNQPTGIAVNSAGDVYVTDSSNNRVQKFTSNRTFVTKWGTEGSGDGQFSYPFGIAVDSAGDVYVTDSSNNRVQKFNSTGGFITQWGSSDSGDGQLYPSGIAVDSEGYVYVTEPKDNRVQKFTSNGTFVTKWGTEGSGDGQFYHPMGIAVDRAGNVYVADMDNNRIQKFNSTGGFIKQWGSSGSGDGQFNQPTGIAVDRAGNVYVADTDNNRIQKFAQVRSPVANFTSNVTAGLVPLAVQFNDTSSGSPISWSWDFGDLSPVNTTRNATHVYTQPGIYTVNLTATNSDDSNSTSKAGYITVTDPPTVGFSANVTAGLSPLVVQFNESTTGSVQYFYWQFGDGSTSFERNPVHVYDAAGKYTVSLYAIGQNGTQVKTIEQYINATTPVTPTVTPTPTTTTTVTPTPTEQNLPVANFTVTFPGGPGSMGIQVADTSVNATSVRYDLGDGTTTAIRNFQYTYWQAGTYTIEQTATNAVGSSHKTLSVTVPAVEPTTTFPPIGGDQGWYTIHCNVDGASVLFDQTPMGTIAGGILRVRVYTTGTPFQTYTVSKDGYTTFHGTITAHPGKDQNVDLTAQLTPIAGPAYNGPHTIPGLLQAEDYDLGGEGVAYHDTTSGNTGGVYRQDDVDIEVLDTDHSPNVGWIRAGEWLTYTVNVSTAGTYDAGFRVASSHTGSSVQVYVDDGTTPIATVNVPNTGDWPVFRTVSVPVTLPAGTHQLKFSFPADFANINWISFAQRG